MWGGTVRRMAGTQFVRPMINVLAGGRAGACGRALGGRAAAAASLDDLQPRSLHRHATEASSGRRADALSCFARNTHGTCIIAGTHQGQLLALSATTGAVTWSGLRLPGAVLRRALAMTPDGAHVCCGTSAGTLHAVATNDGSETWTLKVGPGHVQHLTIGPDGANAFATCDGILQTVSMKFGEKRWHVRIGDFVPDGWNFFP